MWDAEKELPCRSWNRAYLRRLHGRNDQRQLEAIVSIDLKAEERGLNELAEKWKVPFITYTSEQLKSTGEASSSSEFVQQVTGVDNVCERAVKYYLKDEKDGKIIQEKLRLDRMTVSLGMRY